MLFIAPRFPKSASIVEHDGRMGYSVYVCGHSLGGSTALYAANKNRNFVKGGWIFNPGLPPTIVVTWFVLVVYGIALFLCIVAFPVPTSTSLVPESESNTGANAQLQVIMHDLQQQSGLLRAFKAPRAALAVMPVFIDAFCNHSEESDEGFLCRLLLRFCFMYFG